MPSPFPGMDPYLESHWGDVHLSLLTYARDAIQPALPHDLRARIQERIVDGAERADVVDSAGSLLLAFDEVAIERFVEIREVRSPERIATSIEILSPANRSSDPNCDKYQQWCKERSDLGIGLVEIDLLAGFRALPDPSLWTPELLGPAYQVRVRRGWKNLRYEVYPLPLRERLPRIRIPLRESEPDVPLDLQAIVDKCYLNGRYDGIDYRTPPEAHLNIEDAVWADALLREKGLR